MDTRWQYVFLVTVLGCSNSSPAGDAGPDAGSDVVNLDASDAATVDASDGGPGCQAELTWWRQYAGSVTPPCSSCIQNAVGNSMICGSYSALLDGPCMQFAMCVNGMCINRLLQNAA